MIQEKKCEGEGKAVGYGCGAMVNVKLRKYGLGKQCCFNKWHSQYLKDNPKTPKEYTCKGTGQAKGYGCGRLTYNRTYGIGIMCCYGMWLSESDAGKVKLHKAINKVQKPRLDLEKAAAERKNRTGITTLIKSVVTVFHEYVRLRDKGKNCIACGTPWKADFQASHYYKAELYSTLKFDEDNVHSGCVECNIRKEGNLSQYCINLPVCIGLERFEALNRKAAIEKQIDFKWFRDDLISTREYYKSKLKKLKNE